MNIANTLNRIKDGLAFVVATVVMVLGMALFASGVAVVLGLLWFAYILCLLLDRCYVFFLRRLGVREVVIESERNARNASPLMHKAGLVGMTKEERIQTLQHFFSKKAHAYRKATIMGQPTMINSTHGITTTDNQSTEVLDSPAVKEVHNEEVGKEVEVSNEPDLEKHAPSPKEQTTTEITRVGVELEEGCEGSCAICLNDYGTTTS